MYKDFVSFKKFNDILLWVQAICFAVLYSFLYYPQTNFLSDLCLILGALSSCYVIRSHINFQLLWSKYALPIWMILTLFLWVLVHLQFFSQNYELQLRELESIWKRVLIAAIFALGFGINLCNPHKNISRVLWLIYAGLMSPALIYLFKFYLSLVGNMYGFEIPEYLRLYGTYQESIYSIYKAVYIAYWLPAFAVSLSQIFLMFGRNENSPLKLSIFSVGAFLCIYSFYLLGSKNGIANSFIIFLGFFFLGIYLILFKKINLTTRLRLTFILLLFLLVIFTLLSNHLQKFRSWEMLLYDAKIGLQVEKYDHWKYSGKKGYPENELHTPVTNTNYERVAWAIVGISLMKENPLGYGLVDRSVAGLTKSKWHDSDLDQSHSAWIDLTLGIGILGVSIVVMLLVSTNIFLIDMLRKKYWRAKSLINYKQDSVIISIIAILFATSLGWLTSEICQKNQLILLIFWVAFGAGIIMGNKSRECILFQQK